MKATFTDEAVSEPITLEISTIIAKSIEIIIFIVMIILIYRHLSKNG